jgi:hypothetical protein
MLRDFANAAAAAAAAADDDDDDEDCTVLTGAESGEEKKLAGKGMMTSCALLQMMASMIPLALSPGVALLLITKAAQTRHTQSLRGATEEPFKHNTTESTASHTRLHTPPALLLLFSCNHSHHKSTSART